MGLTNNFNLQSSADSLLLASTGDLVRIITSGAADIHVHATYMDINASGVVTPGRTNTQITSGTTTTIIGSPGSGLVRVVRGLLIYNSHATDSNTVTVLHTDGSVIVNVFKATLAFGESIQYIPGIGFVVCANSGAHKTSLNQGTNTTSSSIASVVLSGDVANNNATPNTIADVTALSFSVVSGNTYWFRFIIPYTSAATSTGSRWSINGPTFTRLNYISRYTLTATTITTNAATAYDIPAASNASSLADGNVAVIEGIITPSANGTVIARFASEIANSAITAKAGAVCYYQQIA
jgi:hypothetical protein